MIPLAALKALPWKAIAQVAAIAMLAWGVYSTVTRAWVKLPEAREALEKAQATLKLETECGEGSRCAERQAALVARQDAFNLQVATGYANQLAEINARPVPSGPVRLCRPARQSGVPGAGTPAAADGAAASGVVPLEASGDIGQRLFDLADDADRQALKLKWLQEWNKALAAD